MTYNLRKIVFGGVAGGLLGLMASYPLGCSAGGDFRDDNLFGSGIDADRYTQEFMPWTSCAGIVLGIGITYVLSKGKQ